MDKSKADQIIRDNFKYLKRIAAVEDWDITIQLTSLDKDDFGYCYPDIRYHRALIEIDHDQHTDELHLLETLRHELFHCTLASYALFDNVAMSLIGDDPTKLTALEKTREFMAEQQVYRLEKMHKVLGIPLKDETIQQPDSRPDMGDGAAHEIPDR